MITFSEKMKASIKSAYSILGWGSLNCAYNLISFGNVDEDYFRIPYPYESTSAHFIGSCQYGSFVAIYPDGWEAYSCGNHAVGWNEQDGFWVDEHPSWSSWGDHDIVNPDDRGASRVRRLEGAYQKEILGAAQKVIEMSEEPHQTGGPRGWRAV